MDEKNNLTFIDGQNLYLGTIKRGQDSWEIDLSRLFSYLKRKYDSSKVYYFLGYKIKGMEALYREIISAGFILKFREHNSEMLGIKKGNVDSDIIFQIMKKIYRQEKFSKIILISGDGDYKSLVDFLIEENKFEKILFPYRKSASSLYKNITDKYFDYLDNAKHLLIKIK